MLMVVFGAGASYDSFPSRPLAEWPPGRLHYRLPLADELFDDRDLFNKWIATFTRCQPVIPYLREVPEASSVERELEKLRAEAQTYSERHRQLAAVRFYLQSILWECEDTLKKDPSTAVTSYKTLLDQIQSSRRKNEQVCLVTFNYDTMLEDALPMVGIKIDGLPDYIASNDYKIIKLHGSINWAHPVETPVENVNGRSNTDIANELIERVAKLKISPSFLMVNTYPSSKLHRMPLFPALAIPVETKQDYECPPEHLEALRTCIPEVTKILVIGWRATESNFLRLLSDNLRKEVHVMTVAGDQNRAVESNRRLQEAGIKGKFFTRDAGFSDFVVHREADGFLRS